MKTVKDGYYNDPQTWDEKRKPKAGDILEVWHTVTLVKKDFPYDFQEMRLHSNDQFKGQIIDEDIGRVTYSVRKLKKKEIPGWKFNRPKQ
jgi:hypothetical protein